jgi:hypothetical protein
LGGVDGSSIRHSRDSAKQLAELLKEFAREEAKQERESLEKVQSAKIKDLFGKHLEPFRAKRAVGDGERERKP